MAAAAASRAPGGRCCLPRLPGQNAARERRTHVAKQRSDRVFGPDGATDPPGSRCPCCRSRSIQWRLMRSLTERRAASGRAALPVNEAESQASWLWALLPQRWLGNVGRRSRPRNHAGPACLAADLTKIAHQGASSHAHSPVLAPGLSHWRQIARQLAVVTPFLPAEG